MTAEMAVPAKQPPPIEETFVPGDVLPTESTPIEEATLIEEAIPIGEFTLTESTPLPDETVPVEETIVTESAPLVEEIAPNEEVMTAGRDIHAEESPHAIEIVHSEGISQMKELPLQEVGAEESESALAISADSQSPFLEQSPKDRFVEVISLSTENINLHEIEIPPSVDESKDEIPEMTRDSVISPSSIEHSLESSTIPNVNLHILDDIIMDAIATNSYRRSMIKCYFCNHSNSGPFIVPFWICCMIYSQLSESR
jgi:hypothetical protein